jgi:hypothetical protein
VSEPVPPQNLEAEESVLGAILLAGASGTSGRVLAAIRETGLDAADFYRATHAKVYDAALDDRGEPADSILLAAELERRGELDEIGGRARLGELAATAAATSNAPHFARLVRARAVNLAVLRELEPLIEVARNGGFDQEEAQAALARAVGLITGFQMPSGLEPLDLDAFLAGDPPAVPWLWEGWLACGDLALIVGDPGVGKSLLGLGLADALRRGADFLDDPCTAARVGIFDLENPEAEAHARLRGFGLTADEHVGLYYFHAAGLDLSAGVSALAAALDRYELEVAIIDSLRRAAPGLDENDSAKVSAILSPLRALTATTGRTIALLHHARKRIGDNPTDAGQMVRGSGDLVASVDSLLYLRAKESGSFRQRDERVRGICAHSVPFALMQAHVSSLVREHLEVLQAVVRPDSVAVMYELSRGGVAPLEQCDEPLELRGVVCGERGDGLDHAPGVGHAQAWHCRRPLQPGRVEGLELFVRRLRRYVVV